MCCSPNQPMHTGRGRTPLPSCPVWALLPGEQSSSWCRLFPSSLCQCRCSVLSQPGRPEEPRRVTTCSSIPLEMCTEQCLCLPNSCVLVRRSGLRKERELLPKPWGSQERFQPSSSCSRAGAAPVVPSWGRAVGQGFVPSHCHGQELIPCLWTPPASGHQCKGCGTSFCAPAMLCLMLQSCLGFLTPDVPNLSCPGFCSQVLGCSLWS